MYMYNRHQLDQFTHYKVQTLCKEIGIKVRTSMRKDDIIDLYLNAVTKDASEIVPRPERRTSARIRTTSQTFGPRTPIAVAERAERLRRVKESQYRLGLGRPTLLGGTGARKLTAEKPACASIANLRQPQPTITEEPEPLSIGSSIQVVTAHSQPTQPTLSLRERLLKVDKIIHGPEFADRMHLISDLPMLITDVVEKLQEDTELMDEMTKKLELKKVEIEELRKQSREAEDARSVVQKLVDINAKFTKERIYANNAYATTSGLPATESTLGKRHRETDSAVATPMADEGDISRRMIAPLRKRARISSVNGHFSPLRNIAHGANGPMDPPSTVPLVGARMLPLETGPRAHYTLVPMNVPSQGVNVGTADNDATGPDIDQTDPSTTRVPSMGWLDELLR